MSAFAFDNRNVGTGTQWVAYRSMPDVVLSAPLPSALDVGDGWRGVELRRIQTLDRLDALVEDTGERSDAALGVHVDDGFVYAIAAARGEDPVRLVSGFDPSAPPAAAAHALRRCGVTGEGRRWRATTAKLFAAWSKRAPVPTAQSDVASWLTRPDDASEVASALAGLIGVSVPDEVVLDHLDLQGVARDAPEPEVVDVKRRWFRRDR